MFVCVRVGKKRALIRASLERWPRKNETVLNRNGRGLERCKVQCNGNNWSTPGTLFAFFFALTSFFPVYFGSPSRTSPLHSPPPLTANAFKRIVHVCVHDLCCFKRNPQTKFSKSFFGLDLKITYRMIIGWLIKWSVTKIKRGSERVTG